ncbi:helix-turn-helix transcriptional regulator [Paenibacillus polymyxa]|uniref:helix-turn-helix domain-containing protein n=1 Tax=Paenibacillus polymyxa TaxID=1406 RepID=UPI002AB3A230|nr:helix-turn-helix transcriptional regulator [Paenibacillus polymyxa]MDY7989799.1 helix-turn-helix transcriptional regulator [Paenibacillus polymyxa]MDY8116842.1 helix-turn-helix transcriptional regulator [Paenibacillus polymyxa]
MFHGDRVAYQRKKKKLTQEELALKINLTKAAISNYENGHSTPSNETLVALADVLDVDTDYLLGRTDIPLKEREVSYVKEEYLSQKTSEYVLKELVEKYRIDLTDPHNKETLEKMIKLVYEEL